MNRIAIGAISSALILFSSILSAQVPQLINYQGRVVVGSTNFNGTGSFKFALVNAAGTTAYWTNDGTHLDGTEPMNAVSLSVSNGLYSVLLGDTSLTNMTAVPAIVFNNVDVRLRVWFNDGTHGSEQLAPDQRIAAVGYAVIAGNVSDGAITSAKIANGAVGSAQLANGAVTSAQIDTATVQRRVTASAPPGQFIQSINADGTIVAAAPSEVALTGNTLWVDKMNGNDSTAMRGQLDKPYLTPAAAKTAAKSGDTIRVLAGTYETKNLLKNGVNWILDDGVTLQNTITNGAPGIFDDSSAGANGPVTCSISGNGVIKTTRSGAGDVILISNAASNISIKCKSILQAISSGGTIHVTNGTAFVHADLIDAGPVGTGPWWESGETYVEADQIHAGGIAIYSITNSGSTGNFWVTCKKAISDNWAAIQSVGIEVGTRTWVKADYLGSSAAPGFTTGAVIEQGANKLYVDALKIESLAAASGAGNQQKVIYTHGPSAILWLKSQKVTAISGNPENIFQQDSGTSYLNVDHWESLGNQAAVISNAGGTAFVNGGAMVRTTTGDGIRCSEGFVYVNGAIISTTGTDLKQTGGSLTIAGSAYSTTSGTITQGNPRIANALQSSTVNTNATALNMARQVSTTRDAFVSASINIVTAVAGDGKVELLSDSSNPPTTVIAGPFRVTAGTGVTNTQGGQLCGIVKANNFYQLKTTNTIGTNTFSIVGNVQENVQ